MHMPKWTEKNSTRPQPCIEASSPLSCDAQKSVLAAQAMFLLSSLGEKLTVTRGLVNSQNGFFTKKENPHDLKDENMVWSTNV